MCYNEYLFKIMFHSGFGSIKRGKKEFGEEKRGTKETYNYFMGKRTLSPSGSAFLF